MKKQPFHNDAAPAGIQTLDQEAYQALCTAYPGRPDQLYFDSAVVKPKPPSR